MTDFSGNPEDAQPADRESSDEHNATALNVPLEVLKQAEQTETPVDTTKPG